MSQFGIHILLIGITISVALASDSTFGTKVDVIAMKAIFLDAYCKQIAKHQMLKIDETKRTEFMNAWEQVLGPENAERMLQHLEAHWMYAVKINDMQIPDLTSLNVTIVVRLLALQDGLCYLLCVMYYKQIGIDVMPEHCRKRAAHLIIFSQLQIASLLQKFLNTKLYIRNFPNTYWMNFVRLSIEWQNVALASQKILVAIIQRGQRKYGDALNIETLDRRNIYEIMMRQLATNHKVQQLSPFHGEKTLLIIMMGKKDSEYSYTQYDAYDQWDEKIEMSMWNNALKIDTSNIQEDKENMKKYVVTDLVRENIIWRSELNELSRRNFIEQFEILKPNKLRLWYQDCKYYNTVLSMISTTL